MAEGIEHGAWIRDQEAENRRQRCLNSEFGMRNVRAGLWDKTFITLTINGYNDYN